MGLIKKVFILQSLRDTDIQSGYELSKHLTPHIENNFQNILSKQQLTDSLELIKDECLLDKMRLYVIHFDCHGNEEGVCIVDPFNNDTFLEWPFFRRVFRALYSKTNIMPVISFSSCKGINVMKLMAEFEPCPYNLVTGSLIDIPFIDSIKGYLLFYKNLNANMGLNDNIDEVRALYPQLNFFAFNAEMLVKKAWEKYQETQLTPEKKLERRSDIIRQIMEVNGGIPLTREQEMILDKGLSAEQGLIDQQRYLEIFNKKEE